jgi:DNA-binding NarL/FixJ family response regulator
MTSIRVALADDHQVVRIGVRSILEKAPDIVVVGEANNGMGALRLVSELAPDILLLDIEMPGMTGVEVARYLQASGSPVRVLALSAYDDAQYIAALLASGAAGYLTKDEAMDMIVDAVRGVARGEQGWLSARLRSSAGKVAPGVKGSLG